MPSLTDRELLARLVAFPSLSCRSNRPIADFIANYLDAPGVRVAQYPFPEEDKVNLLISLGPPPREGKRGGILLSGHLDVVPADEEGWESDPFVLTETDDRYIGRGTADMKGFVTLAVNVAKELDPHRLRRPLVLLFTHDEELGTLGASRFVAETAAGSSEASLLPKNAIVGEPTSLQVVSAHKGHLKLRVILRGRSAHSAYPHLGQNAIAAAGLAIAALSRLRQALEGERLATSDLFPEVPFPTLNLGTVHGGVAINIIPDRCVLELGIRLLPGMEAQEMIHRVRKSLESVLPSNGFLLETLSESPAMLLPAQAEIRQVLGELVGQRQPRSVSFASDAGWLQKLGIACALFGPGSIETAHRPNEWLPKAEFTRARELVGRVVEHFCVTPQEVERL